MGDLVGCHLDVVHTITSKTVQETTDELMNLINFCLVVVGAAACHCFVELSRV